MASEVQLRVLKVESEAVDVISVVFEAADGSPLPPWEPGAHLSLDLPIGRRQYSLCNDPGDATYTVAVLRSPESRGGSTYVHDRLVVGSVVSSRPPRNNFPLDDDDSYLFIAGGIGITPILPMVRAVERAGKDWRLVYGGRSRESMAFTDELRAYSSRVDLVPQDTHGLIDVDGLLGDGTTRSVYCCGPEPLLRAVQQHPGLASGAVHLERFSAAEDDEEDLEATDTAFEVRCARSGQTVDVRADQTMLDALLAAGLDVDSDCEEGICGTCELAVLAGEADHRDEILTDEERRSLILPCVSRARGRSITVEL